MADVEDLLTKEARTQRLIAGGALLGIILGGLLQRDYRALALTDVVAPTPAAFAAIVPPAAPAVAEPVVPGAPRARAFRRGARTGNAAPPAGGGDQTQLALADVPPSPIANGGSPGADVVSDGANDRPILRDIGPGSTGFSAPVLLANGPGGGGSPGGVPEPSTWLVMILGIGGIGALLRRARRRETGAGDAAIAG